MTRGTPRIIEYRTKNAPLQWAFVARGRVIKNCENGLLEVIDIDTGRLVGVPQQMFVRDVPPPEDQEPHVAVLEAERSRLLEVKSIINEEMVTAGDEERIELAIEDNQVGARLGKVFEALMTVSEGR